MQRETGFAPQEQRTEQHTYSAEPTVIVVEQDNTLLWVSGVVVPLVVAAATLYFQRRWAKAHGQRGWLERKK